VYAGSKRGGTISGTVIEDISKIETGQLVAVNCENYAQEPVIGQCTQISGDTIEVGWMKGSYSTPWRSWMVRDPKNRRKHAHWHDWIPLSSVLLFDFELTSTNHFRKATVDHLKKEYAKIHQH